MWAKDSNCYDVGEVRTIRTISNWKKRWNYRDTENTNKKENILPQRHEEDEELAIGTKEL